MKDMEVCPKCLCWAKKLWKRHGLQWWRCTKCEHEFNTGGGNVNNKPFTIERDCPDCGGTSWVNGYSAITNMEGHHYKCPSCKDGKQKVGVVVREECPILCNQCCHPAFAANPLMSKVQPCKEDGYIERFLTEEEVMSLGYTKKQLEIWDISGCMLNNNPVELRVWKGVR
jgi:hypothetical protein